MDRFSFSSDSGRRERRNRYCIAVGVVSVLVVILVTSLLVGLRGPHKSSKPGFVPMCAPVLQDVKRFDCHPERPISQQACLDRGCCFVKASDIDVKDFDLINSSYLGVPSCFFPANHNGYVVSKKDVDGSRITAELDRQKPSGLPEDISKVKLEVRPIDDNRLRITISDANNQRYRPEVPVLTVRYKDKGEEAYNVNFTDGGILEVTRIDNQQVVFRTDLARLIFSDQFLQLSTDLPSEYIYGLSEHKEGILKSTNWARYTLFNQGDLPVPHRNLYGSHPFYMVMEPDGKSSGVFLMNSNAIDYVVQPTPAISIRTIGGIFDFFIFLGPSPADVVTQYSNLFGMPFMPPRWSLGFHLCKYGYFTLDKTKEILKRNLDAGVPVEIQWHDIDFMNRYLDFTYDPVNFTGLPEFVEELHKEGRYYVAMFSPGLSNKEEPKAYYPYEKAKELDLFIKDTNGVPIEGKVWNTNTTVYPDFSHIKMESFWNEMFRTYHKELKFDGAWIDMNEPLNFLNGSNKGCPVSKFDNPPYLPGRPYPLNTLTLCMSAKHQRTEHYNEHNLMAYREAKRTNVAITDMLKMRPFIISRASFAGQGVFSGHWSGDITSNWEDMRYTIPAMLAFSLYGMAMTGSDICGFRLNTTEELCARWQSLGAFYPFSRNHNDFDTIEQDPAGIGGDVLESTKKALKIRYYLIPYLYTLFYRSHVFGETVARPLFFEFPLDKNTYTIEDEFLWGPAFLVMPALHEGVKSIKPYIPEGVWYDYHTGELRNSTGTRYDLKAEITHINLAIRGGYILPAQEPQGTPYTTTKSAKSPFDFLVALDSNKQAKGELYWDDGTSLDAYVLENYTLIKMTAEKNVVTINTVKNFSKIEMKLGSVRVFGVESSPSGATVNGNNATFTFEENELKINGDGISLLNNVTVEWQ